MDVNGRSPRAATRPRLTAVVLGQQLHNHSMRWTNKHTALGVVREFGGVGDAAADQQPAAVAVFGGAGVGQ
jgi:hypothetical protein